MSNTLLRSFNWQAGQQLKAALTGPCLQNAAVAPGDLPHPRQAEAMVVFIMLFVFIAIVCFAAVFVIAYTRCMTIALNNRQVYEDLGKLGASRAYLYASVKGKVSRVFTVPVITGTGAIYAFYAMIMYANDGRLSPGEVAGMGACLLLILAVSLLMYAVYRLTLKRVCRALNI